jgi:hypothetical protein
MPDLPPALLQLATELRVHRHFLRELRRAESKPAFSQLPPRARERHGLLTRGHEEAHARLRSQAAGHCPEPTLVDALVTFLEREGQPLTGHPTARHLDLLERVFQRLVRPS